MTSVLMDFPKAEPNGRGGWSIHGLKVFRAGKMKDSKGRQRQWEIDHLDQMIANFNYLRQRQLFVDVPVRADHSISVRNVVGYFESVRREDNFIVADLEITEKDAADKWNRRTWRARSLEVGAYESNDESVYWPAIMGVAFVDIGAVEGLYQHGPSTSPTENFSQVLVDDDKETYVATPEELKAAADKAAADAKTAADAKAAADKAAADAKAAADKAAEDAKTAADKVAADAAVKAASDAAAAAQAAADQATSAAKAAADKAAADKAAADAAAAQAAATHRAGGTQTFRFGSEEVTDPVEVQRRIDAFNKFQQEQVAAGRRAFVEQLATDNKIAATQKDSLITFALALTDDQFVQFQAGYKDAPTLALFGAHGTQTGGTPPPAGGTGGTRTAEQEKADLMDIVSMHRRTGMPDEQLRKTDSYRRLTQLDPAGYPA